MDQRGHRVDSALQGTLIYPRLADETEEKPARYLSETPLQPRMQRRVERGIVIVHPLTHVDGRVPRKHIHSTIG